jgi:hypothetical protein
MERRAAMRSEAEGQRKDVSSMAATDAESELSFRVSQAISDKAVGAGATSFQVINKKINDLRDAGGIPDAKTTLELQRDIAVGRAKAEQQLWQVMNNPQINPTTGKVMKSYSAQISDPAKAKAIVEKAMAPWDTITNAIVNQQYGVVNWAATTNKIMIQTQLGNVYARDEVALNSTVLKEIGGDNGFNAAMQDGKNMSDFVNSARGIISTRSAVGKVPALASELATVKPVTPKEDFPVLSQALVTQHVNSLLDTKGTSDKAAVGYAKALFSEGNKGFLGLFTPESRMPLYTQMGSPAMTKRMDALSKTPEGAGVWNDYKRWMIENFRGQFKQAGDELQTNIESDRFQIEFNAASNTWSATVRPEFEANYRMVRDRYNGYIPSIQKPVDDLNRAIELITPVLARDKQNVPAELDGLFKSMNIDVTKAPKGTRAERDAGFWGRAGEALIKALPALSPPDYGTVTTKPKAKDEGRVKNPENMPGVRVNPL